LYEYQILVVNIDGSTLKTAVIIDPHRLFRSILKRALKDLDVIGEAEDRHSALELVARQKPDFGFLSPDQLGIPIIRDIIACHDTIKLIILSTKDLENYASAAITMGASAYCLKYNGISAVRDAIACVERGEKYFSPSLC
jgi:DNA-binding NarL/FixJ family response regulator